MLFGSVVWVSWSRDSITLNHHWPLGQFSAVRSPLGQSIQPVNCPFSTSHSSGSSSRVIITSESPSSQSSLGQLFILCLLGTFVILGAISSYSLRTLGLPSLRVLNQSKCTLDLISYSVWTHHGVFSQLSLLSLSGLGVYLHSSSVDDATASSISVNRTHSL